MTTATNIMTTTPTQPAQPQGIAEEAQALGIADPFAPQTQQELQLLNVYGFTVYRQSQIQRDNQLGEGVMVLGANLDEAHTTLTDHLDAKDVITISGGMTILQGVYALMTVPKSSSHASQTGAQHGTAHTSSQHTKGKG